MLLLGDRSAWGGTAMPKSKYEHIKIFLFLALAVWLAVHLVDRGKNVLGWLAATFDLPVAMFQDPKVLGPLITPLIYFIEQLIYSLLSMIPQMYRIPLIGRLFDNKAMFIGTYLSLPSVKEEINVFTIKYDAWGGRYKLMGYAYSSGPDPIGDWNSDKLNLDTKEPVNLSYVYDGQRYGEARVRGLVYIPFHGAKPVRGISGYWVDVSDSGTAANVKRSNYVKLSNDIRRKLFPSWMFFDSHFPFVHLRWFVNRPSTILKAYQADKDKLDKDSAFARP
jgi:hypothetical protein